MIRVENISAIKRVLTGLICLSCAALLAQDSGKIKDCKCMGISLHGRVKVVEAHADFRVKVVDAHPDLKVKKVGYNSNRCGEWRFVDNHPDFSVRFVDAHEDFKIQYVR